VCEAQIDRYPAPLFFLQAVSIDASKSFDQRGLPVIDMARGADNDGFHGRSVYVGTAAIGCPVEPMARHCTVVLQSASSFLARTAEGGCPHTIEFFFANTFLSVLPRISLRSLRLKAFEFLPKMRQ
jgi:hypothetical protein